jgi:hypothetical protein
MDGEEIKQRIIAACHGFDHDAAETGRIRDVIWLLMQWVAFWLVVFALAVLIVIFFRPAAFIIIGFVAGRWVGKNVDTEYDV